MSIPYVDPGNADGRQYVQAVYIKGQVQTDPFGALAVPGVANSGVYVALGVANTDPGGVAIPSAGTAAAPESVSIWFETSAADATLTRGRVGFNASATAIAGLTGTDLSLGYQRAETVTYPIRAGDTHLHVASPVASAVVRGAWRYGA